MNRIALAVTAIGALITSGCMTVNELDRVDLAGARMGSYLATVPEPEVDVAYDLTFNPDNPIATAVSIGANIAKATIATRADDTMRKALGSIDLPAEVAETSFARCAEALGTVRVYDTDYRRSREAEYLFEVEIRSWGIKADSPAGAVRFHLSLVAAIVDLERNDLVWRRSVTIDEYAHPGLFGLPSEVGSAISAAALANLSEAQMRRGFEALAKESSIEVARKLERDMIKSTGSLWL